MAPSEVAGHDPTGDIGELTLAIRDLQVVFPTDAGRIRAVDGVTCSVYAGRTLAVVGESGSGKSVTGLSIMRLAERSGARMVGGTISLRRSDGDCVELTALHEADMAKLRGREVAMVFQDPMSSLNPVFTVGDQIGEPLRIHYGVSRRAAREAAIALLEQVGIADPAQRVHAYPHQLSGGMRQRAMLAMALACDPRLLIADEPTTALDVTVQRQVLQLMRAMAVKSNTAILFISHDLALVSQFCQRVYVMYAGSIVESGVTRTVLRHPQHPYAQALIRALPESAGRGERLQAIAGHVPDLVHAPCGCAFAPRCAHAFAACSKTPTLLSTPVGSRAACWRVAERPARAGA